MTQKLITEGDAVGNRMMNAVMAEEGCARGKAERPRSGDTFQHHRARLEET